MLTILWCPTCSAHQDDESYKEGQECPNCGQNFLELAILISIGHRDQEILRSRIEVLLTDLDLAERLNMSR